MLDRLSRPTDVAPADLPIGNMARHLNLTLATVLAPAFDVFVERLDGASLGVEIALMDACADPAGYLVARRKLAGTGATLILDSVSAAALQLSSPWEFGADLIKIEWSPRFAGPDAADHERLAEALHRLDPRRIILHRTDSEGAVRWGLTNGIQRFQGRQIDAMLAASRLGTCGLAAGCSLRQCVERAASLSAAGRSGCGNHALLDAAVAEDPGVLSA